MKIICVGRNYAKHIEELNNEIPSQPVIFIKPETARLKNGQPFFYPEHSKDIHYEAELVIRVSKNGKHIKEEFAPDYYNELTLGIDLTARDTQSMLKEKGLPWELAKAFDHSAVIGDFMEINELNNPSEIEFSLKKNDQTVQEGNSNMMLYPINKLIEFVSKYFFLKQGDLIFTGTPAGVGPIAIDDVYTGAIEGKNVLKLKVK